MDRKQSSLCQQAYDTYEKEQHTVGELECFNTWIYTIESLPVLVEMTVSVVCKANKLIEVLNLWPTQRENIIVTLIRQIETFYGTGK